MPRIRSIKPELWADEALSGVCRDARLLFIGMFNFADDHGRMRGSPLLIRSQVFPYDSDVDVEKLLRILASPREASGGTTKAGFIQRYTHDGESFVWIRNFTKHQKIDHPSRPQFPEPPLADTNENDTPETKPREPSRALTESSRKISLEQGAGSREQGVDLKRPLAAVASPTDKPEATPEQAACRKAIRDRFVAEYSKRAGGAEFRWSGAENTAIKALAALDGAGGIDPTKGLLALGTFVDRMPVKRYYAENFAPRIVVQELNNLRVALVADAPRGRGPGAAGASRPVASAADFERDAVEHERRLQEASK